MFIIITIPESEEVGRHSNSADIIKYNPKQSDGLLIGDYLKNVLTVSMFLY